jgi:hypothetical protein
MEDVRKERLMSDEIEYRTALAQWKAELEEQLDRRVQWYEVEKGTGIAYSTLQKHVTHRFKRPDYAIAERIAAWFSKMSRSKRKYTAHGYYEKVVDEGQQVAVA